MELLMDRIERAEKQIHKLYKKPVITIPEYDLQGPTVTPTTTAYIQWATSGVTTAFAPIVVDVDNLIIMHYNRLGSCNVSINGNSENIVSAEGISQFKEFVFGTLSGDPFFPVPGSAGAKYSFSNLKIGTSLHGTDIFSDSLSSIPSTPTYDSVVSNDFSIVAGKLQVELGHGGAEARYKASSSYDEVWVEFIVNFDSSFVDWLTGIGDFERGPILCDMRDQFSSSFSDPVMSILTYAT